MQARICLLLTALALITPVAWATDLVNKDSATYAVAISSGASVMTASIAGRTTKIGVCASTAAKCVVSVDGVGEIEVTGADDVIIENGRLSKK
jgi:hypothetical protein